MLLVERIAGRKRIDRFHLAKGARSAFAMIEIENFRSQLLKEGFTTVRGITDADDVQNIRDCMISVLNEKAQTGALRHAAGALGDQKIVVDSPSVLRPQLLQSQFFQRAYEVSRQILGSSITLYVEKLMIKPSHTPQATEWHQDGAYNRKLFGFIITRSPHRLHWWLPLQAVDTDNGCMQFIPASHRARVYPHVSRLGSLQADLPVGAVPAACPLGVGDATVHLLKTLHYTGPNNSDAPRHAWIVQFLARGRIPTIV
jgi:ectoine hydroxylase-related dioxygenase (phytanoyl-CoA dioxygenase family)